MDARRLELYELLKPTLMEAPARALVLALPPGPEELVTKTYLDAKLSVLRSELRTDMSSLSEQMSRLEAKLTWRMVGILGGWTVAVASMFGWLSQLVQ